MRSPCTAAKRSPRSPQLEKAHVQQRRPNAAKNELKTKKVTVRIKCIHVYKVPSAWHIVVTKKYILLFIFQSLTLKVEK